MNLQKKGLRALGGKFKQNKLKKSIACIPDFVNAAFGIPVEASSTCGETPREFCSAAKKNQQTNKRKRNIGDFGSSSYNRLPIATAAASPNNPASTTPSECQLCDRQDFLSTWGFIK